MDPRPIAPDAADIFRVIHQRWALAALGAGARADRFVVPDFAGLARATSIRLVARFARAFELGGVGVVAAALALHANAEARALRHHLCAA